MTIFGRRRRVVIVSDSAGVAISVLTTDVSRYIASRPTHALSLSDGLIFVVYEIHIPEMGFRNHCKLAAKGSCEPPKCFAHAQATAPGKISRFHRSTRG